MTDRQPPSGVTTPPALFAVCLGGRAAGCNVELHDVVFVVGDRLESTHEQLLARWFGQSEDLHIDAWARLDQVAGYRVQLEREPSDSDLALYFVNIGGYQPGEFGERHAYGFFAGASRAEVKQRAFTELLQGKQSVHRDDLYDIDDCIAIEPGGGWHIHLQADPAATSPTVTNGYFPLPRATIRDWQRRTTET